jgi:hypothetical protein
MNCSIVICLEPLPLLAEFFGLQGHQPGTNGRFVQFWRTQLDKAISKTTQVMAAPQCDVSRIRAEQVFAFQQTQIAILDRVERALSGNY